MGFTHTHDDVTPAVMEATIGHQRIEAHILSDDHVGLDRMFPDWRSDPYGSHAADHYRRDPNTPRPDRPAHDENYLEFRRQHVGNFNFGSPVLPGLSKLMEECAEVGTVGAKLMSTVGHPEHFADPDLHEQLLEEMADVAAAITFMLCYSDAFTDEQIERYKLRRTQKQALFLQWHEDVDLPPHLHRLYG